MKITIELDSFEELKLWAEFSSKQNLKEKSKPLELDNLDLSIRTMNCFSEEKIYTVEALLKFTENELLKIPNFGRRSLNELKKALARNQLHLRFA